MVGGLTIPDQPYIEQIRRRLWSGREVGQAAVMVGAGFSRNAERLLPSIPPFPLWGDLAKRMSNALYPPPAPSATDDQSVRYISPNDALKLATEYATIFTPSALDDLILRTIPDDSYYPGRLHRLLLSLPWSDVFTTNYDTLLERTLPSIHDRKYDVILTASGIPGSMKPRIVKLHGSFPAHRPFIVTEEHFRTYPTRFAPFVNIVQQSIMENALCLIGFSGEDPNFLFWTGWVRDNLGDATPPIYLCSLSPVSLSQRRVLEARKVFTIDLSHVLSPVDVPDSSIRFARALEWFLLALMDGAPPNLINFPKITRTAAWAPSNGVPPLPHNPSVTIDLGEQGPEHLSPELEVDTLRALHRRWREQRSVYPNWVVLPNENREMLWFYTDLWEEPVLRSLHKLPAPEGLALLYELNWRLERCLLPVSEESLSAYTSVIDDFNPFPTLVINESAHYRPDRDEHRHLDWGEISMQWVELKFALVREARERLDGMRFDSLINTLSQVIPHRPEWQARWNYEQCLFWLSQMNQDNVFVALSRWPMTPDLPFWDVKRAAVLAEIGELDDAERIAEGALAAIRARLQPYTTDYALLSQEGWTMLQLQSLKNNRIGTTDDAVAQYRDRWQRLISYRCNPWADLETSELIVKAIDPNPTPPQLVRRGFYPETQTISHRLGYGIDAQNLRNSYSFLRMFEEGALPFRCGIVSFFSEAVVNAAKCIAVSAPEWSLSAMLRTLDQDELKGWFDYVQVATLDTSKIDYLFNLFRTSLIQATQRLQSAAASDRIRANILQLQTRLFSELLSRLCIRLRLEQLDQLFQLAKDMYVFPLFRQYPLSHECVGTLFEKLLRAVPQEYKLQAMAELLRLPIPTENGFEVGEPQMWKEPFLYLKWADTTSLPPGFDREPWDAPITNLIRIVKDGAGEARIWAVSRLKKVHEIEALSEDERAAFGEALWARIDPTTNLPADTGLYHFAFLNLPSPNMDSAEESLRGYLLSGDFPRIIRRGTAPNGGPTMSMGIGMSKNQFIHEWLGSSARVSASENVKQRYIQWAPTDVAQLLVKAAQWWDAEKDVLAEENPPSAFGFAGALINHFSQLVTLLSDVILPRLPNAEDATKTLALRLLNEMEDSGIKTLPALPMVLFVTPGRYDEVVLKLRRKLQSREEAEVRAAITGTYKWLIRSLNN